MIPIATSMRMQHDEHSSEMRDALDQRWHAFAEACGLMLLPVPNVGPKIATWLNLLEPHGILLTGGNDLTSLGGTTPIRDETEQVMIHYALKQTIPVLGVCRGMQHLITYFGGTLEAVSGHAGERHSLHHSGIFPTEVNSYHHYGTQTLPPPLQALATASCGTIEAMQHKTLPILGIMWHPEREPSSTHEDVSLFRHHFRSIA